jgi:hypothetical protein
MLERGGTAQPDPEVVATALPNGEVVLLHLGAKSYYSLNQTGSRIWQMSAERRTLGEISDGLQEEFDVTPEVAWQSTVDLVEELADARLVRIVA